MGKACFYGPPTADALEFRRLALRPAPRAYVVTKVHRETNANQTYACAGMGGLGHRCGSTGMTKRAAYTPLIPA